MAQEKTGTGSAQGDILSFDLMIIVHDVIRKWRWILAAAILAGLLSYVWKDVSYRPEYTTNTTFVVTYQGSSSTVYQNLSTASGLTAVFSEVLNSSVLKKTISEELGLPEFDAEIHAEVIPETNLLTMQVTAADPGTAFRLTKAIIENHGIVTDQILGSTVLEILQKPQVPTEPSNSSASMSAMKRCAVIAAAAVCALFAVSSFLSDKIRSRQELEEKLECAALAELPHENRGRTLQNLLHRRKNEILITGPMTSFRFTENMKRLRHRVEAQQTDKEKVLLVTSALEGEGKTVVAVNLALSFAQKQKKVLLIDADLRSPNCSKTLNIEWKETGFSDVLQGRRQFRNACRMMPKNNYLTLLLQGKSDPAAAGILGSEQMQSVLEEARENFDVIILDTPPTTAAADTESVLPYADEVLMVVRQNMAKTPILLRSVETLQSSSAELIGCVLNDSRSAWLSARGGYGYDSVGSYGFGYGKNGKYGKYGGYGKQNSRTSAQTKRGYLEHKEYE